jgi:cobalamin synthase
MAHSGAFHSHMLQAAPVREKHSTLVRPAAVCMSAWAAGAVCVLTIGGLTGLVIGAVAVLAVPAAWLCLEIMGSHEE